MLEVGQVWMGPLGDQVVISSQTRGIGEIFWASVTLGPVETGTLVTEQGLVEAGYQLQQ